MQCKVQFDAIIIIFANNLIWKYWDRKSKPLTFESHFFKIGDYSSLGQKARITLLKTQDTQWWKLDWEIHSSFWNFSFKNMALYSQVFHLKTILMNSCIFYCFIRRKMECHVFGVKVIVCNWHVIQHRKW